MRKLITELTEAQQCRLHETYREWLKIGRNCAPIDKTAAAQIIAEFYTKLGKPSPVVMVFSSPMMCALAYGALHVLKDKLPAAGRPQENIFPQLGAQLRAQLRAQLGDQLWAQLGDQLWDQLGAQLRAQLGDQLWDQLGAQLWDQLRDQLWDQLRDQLRAQLWDQLWAQLGDQLWDQLWAQLGAQPLQFFGGQHVVAWQVFYRFCEEIGVRYTPQQSELLRLWIREGRDLHWWLPCEGSVLLSERHTILQLDERGRLHSETGMACAYSDSWGVYAWHGVRVPDWVILQPEKITVSAIQQEPNAEVRRAMLERFGLDRFLRESKATLVHRDTLKANFPQYVNAGDGKREFLGYIPGEETISLYELPVQNAEGRNARVVHVLCPSTMRDYVIGVDATHSRAVAAVASTFGLTEEEYREGNFARQGDVLIRPLGEKWPKELRGRHS